VTDPFDLFGLRGRVAVVTGGSRGLGREIAIAFARAGADVVVASRKLDACELVAEEIRTTTGRRVLAVACHVGDWDDSDRLVERTYAEFGSIHVLVNNAGSSPPPYDRPTSVTEALFDRTIAVNLRGTFRLTALIGERMAQGDGGSIINVSSIASMNPSVHEIPYAAAKAGVNAMTVAFAHAYGPKVRVNALVLGAFLTDIAKAWDMESFGRLARRFDLKRGAEPREIIGSALFLASDASSYVTGAFLHVDGGAR
jgi:NAD(P)-dependent dehydrogenase (short-subunit alcohol dehydrogenase family)